MHGRKKSQEEASSFLLTVTNQTNAKKYFENYLKWQLKRSEACQN